MSIPADRRPVSRAAYRTSNWYGFCGVAEILAVLSTLLWSLSLIVQRRYYALLFAVIPLVGAYA